MYNKYCKHNIVNLQVCYIHVDYDKYHVLLCVCTVMLVVQLNEVKSSSTVLYNYVVLAVLACIQLGYNACHSAACAELYNYNHTCTCSACVYTCTCKYMLLVGCSLCCIIIYCQCLGVYMQMHALGWANGVSKICLC